MKALGYHDAHQPSSLENDQPSMMPPVAASVRRDRSLPLLYWLASALFVAYLCIAAALPVIPVFVTTRLGYGNGLAGLAVGIAFASTILTRGLAGRIADTKGSRRCMMLGLLAYACAGLICGGAGWAGPAPIAYAVLLAGRLLLGLGESLATVGLIAWCFGVTGPHRSGLVFAVVGMALYAALAAGSPAGVALFEWSGFAGVMAACTVAPVVALLMVLPVQAVAIAAAGARPSFWRIIGRIWQPGVALTLQGVGSAAIGAFITVMFLSRGWPHAGLGLTCFGGAFVLVRVVAGHLPDRIGSVPVALVSMIIEAVGQLLLWQAPNPAVALGGAALTGLGCSLMFPAMGIEVVRRVPAHLRGTAAGGLAMFQDLALGATGPVAGALADRLGYSAVFLAGAVAASASVLIVMVIGRSDRHQAD